MLVGQNRMIKYAGLEGLPRRMLQVPRMGGYREQGWHAWCCSLIRAERAYHLFASRWPCATGFPQGYMTHSEIVRAVSETPVGPFQFVETVLRGRGGRHWDGQMCHNPKIVRVADGFALFYIGRTCGSRRRQIGVAWAPSVRGPWTRRDLPLALGEDANNPAPFVHPDGSVLLAYRDRALRMHMARADRFDGEYRVVAENIFPAGKLEDPDLFFSDGRYGMVVEDNEGRLTGHERFGGLLVSDDGCSWTPATEPVAYTHTIEFDDGSAITASRRERPALFNDDGVNPQSGRPTHLLTGVLHDGVARCIIQPLVATPDSVGGNPMRMSHE